MTNFNTPAPVNPTNPLVQNAEYNSVQPQKPTMMTMSVKKVNLRDYGTEQSLAHKGNADALYNAFLEIRSGHIIDENADIEQQQKYQLQLDDKIANFEKDVIGLESASEQITAVEIPNLERTIEELETEIHEWVLEKHQAQKPDTVNRFNLFRLGIMCLLGLVYVFAFYVSAVYMGMMRDIDKTFEDAQKNHSMNAIFNAVFSKEAFSTFNFHWFAPILLLMFALGIEQIWKSLAGKKRIALLILAILFTAALDAIIAYKIESTNQQVKMMMGLENPNHIWWKSGDFYAVLMMGFIGTLVWGGLSYAFTEELGKTDLIKIVNLEVNRRKNKIREIRERIASLKSSIVDLQSRMKQLEVDMKRLREQKQTMKVSMAELERYAAMFYDGWIKLVSTIPNGELLRSQCEQKYILFREKYILPDKEIN